MVFGEEKERTRGKAIWFSVVKRERELKLGIVLVSLCACKGRERVSWGLRKSKKKRKGRRVPRLVQPELPVEASFFLVMHLFPFDRIAHHVCNLGL